MKTAREYPLNTQSSAQTLLAIRHGQAILGRAYFEFRNLAQADAIAELRLVYGLVERIAAPQVTDSLEEANRHMAPCEAPFCQDPWATDRESEPFSALDSIAASDAQLFAQFSCGTDCPTVDPALLTRWQVAREAIAPSPQAIDSALRGDDREEPGENRFAMCG